MAADILDGQRYDVIDRMVVRVITEAGFSTVEGIADFLSVNPPLVQRCITYLEHIGHARLSPGSEVIQLTDLGRTSFEQGQRYELKRVRQTIMIERFTGQPFPKRHYDGAVQLINTVGVPRDRTFGQRFDPVFSAKPFSNALVESLVAREDRAELNIDERMRQLQVVSVADSYLGVYLIETADGQLLTYTDIGIKRDRFLESVAADSLTLKTSIEGRQRSNPREIWTAWLARNSSRYGRGRLREMPGGGWRATFSRETFGDASRNGPSTVGKPLPERRLGSYEIQSNEILQLWCDDAEYRRDVMLTQALGRCMRPDVESEADVLRVVSDLAARLEVPAPGLPELRLVAAESQHRASDKFERLKQQPQS